MPRRTNYLHCHISFAGKFYCNVRLECMLQKKLNDSHADKKMSSPQEIQFDIV